MSFERQLNYKSARNKHIHVYVRIIKSKSEKHDNLQHKTQNTLKKKKESVISVTEILFLALFIETRSKIHVVDDSRQKGPAGFF